jgi:MFS family permease
MIQGVGGALLMTNSVVIVTDAFRKGNIGFALGVNGVAFSAGFLLGPLVGGVLTTISWRLVFLVNVPIGIFGTIYGVYKLRDPVVPLADQIFDWAGGITFTTGLTALLLAVSLYAFPTTGVWVVYVMCVVTVVSFAAFIFVEGRVRQPILNIHLLSNRVFTYATAASGLSGLARGAVLFVLIFFFQGPYGLDPLTTGILMTPFGAALLVTAPISGRLSDRYGARYLATGGLLIDAGALIGMATIVSTTPYWVLAVLMALIGAGSGIFWSPNTNAAMSAVQPNERGAASGIRTMVQNTGQMLAIAIAFPLVLSTLPVAVLYHVFLYGGGLSGDPLVLAAFELGMHQAFLVSAAISALAAIISFMRPKHAPDDATAAK